MALLFADGFDVYADLNDVRASNWAIGNTNNTFSTSNGRHSGGCLQGSGDDDPWFINLSIPVGTVLIVAWAHFYTSWASGDDFLFRIQSRDIGNSHFSILHNNTGGLFVTGQPGTQIGSTAAAVLSAGWNWIECKVTLGTNNTDGALEVRVNGATVQSATGIDTFGNNTNSIPQRLSWFGGNAAWRVDDVIVMDNTGSTMNDFIGDSRIETLKPDGNGGTMAWTGSYTDVDETPNSADGDTTYISSATATQEARFTMSALSSFPATVHSVQLRAKARKADAGTRTYRGLINSASNELTGPTKALNLNYNWERLGTFDVNPNGSVAWNGTDINALQAGVEIVA